MPINTHLYRNDTPPQLLRNDNFLHKGDVIEDQDDWVASDEDDEPSDDREDSDNE